MKRALGAVAALVLFAVHAAAQSSAAPVIVVQTEHGTFELETYPDDAPKTVAHIVALVKEGFYDGQRIHRAIPGFLVQWGDPRSRDPQLRADWGLGAAASSGHPVGVAEMPARHYTKGAVGLAHPGVPALGDSQMFVTLADRPDLDGRYTLFGQVISGEDVPEQLQTGDVITRVYVKERPPQP